MSIPAWNIFARVSQLEQEVDKLMSDQAGIDAEVEQINTAVQGLQSAVTGIQAELDAAKQANPGVDLTGLTAAVDNLQSATSSVEGLVTPTTPDQTPPDQPPDQPAQ